ncbi:TetR/AcrR family transcriptional regulator [Okibacterium fritillariae]|uniref:TetR/AcrR family transcriptional regulator n=1 Tax=Okibacterium fritillariae TaxID=123320 RepID=UPI00405554D4
MDVVTTTSPDRPARRDATRNRAALIDAAMVELRDDPDASLDAIAARAGLSRRAVYGHFATREDLVLTVVEAGAARIAQGIGTVGTDDSRVAIATIGARLWASVSHVRVMADLAVRGPYRSTVAAALAPIRRTLRDVIEDGVSRGQLRRDIPPAVVARLVEDAALTVLGEATRSGIDDDHAARLVMLAGLSGAGLGWQEAGLVVDETLRNGLVNA